MCQNRINHSEKCGHNKLSLQTRLKEAHTTSKQACWSWQNELEDQQAATKLTQTEHTLTRKDDTSA